MSLPAVFADMDRFGFVHHRALNSPDVFRAAVQLATSRSDVCHVLEGDLCWDTSGGRRCYYFRHPKWLLDTLTPVEQDRARAEGRLVTLEDVLGVRTPSLRYIIELKVASATLTRYCATSPGCFRRRIRAVTGSTASRFGCWPR
jgi:hypothetical protein